MFGIRREEMFDHIDENIGEAIKAKIFETFGFYPVLDLSERWDQEEWDDGKFIREYNLRDYHAILDLEKIDQVDDFSLGYVKHLLGYLIEARIKNSNLDELGQNASKKYCFSDTEDWWDAMRLRERPEGREIFTYRIEIG